MITTPKKETKPVAILSKDVDRREKLCGYVFSTGEFHLSPQVTGPDLLWGDSVLCGLSVFVVDTGDGEENLAEKQYRERMLEFAGSTNLVLLMDPEEIPWLFSLLSGGVKGFLTREVDRNRFLNCLESVTGQNTYIDPGFSDHIVDHYL